MREREKQLQSVYGQLARSFADLHDTPQRMVAKGVVKAIVPWEGARKFFVARLAERMAEVGTGIRQIPRDLASDEAKLLEAVREKIDNQDSQAFRTALSQLLHS